jgi:hypothetical protein
MTTFRRAGRPFLGSSGAFRRSPTESRFGAKVAGLVLAAGVLGSVVPLISAGTAGASTTAVSYSTGIYCQSAGSTGYISLNFPTEASGYPGTTEMYFEAQLQYASGGQWVNSGPAVDDTAATAWGGNGTAWFSPI